MANSGFSDHILPVYGSGGDGSIYDIPKSYLDMLATQESGDASISDLQNPQPVNSLHTSSSSDDNQENADNKRSEAKKKNPKKQLEPRFAFLTKTEVGCLDDCYNWRKYGQKAVKKNYQFPRSYYRCTSESCEVKKTIERSLKDPSILVTTYVGTHTHPRPETSTYYRHAADRRVFTSLLPQLYHHQQPPPPPQPLFYNQSESSRFNRTNINNTNVVPSSYSYHPQEAHFCPFPLPYSLHAEPTLLEDTSYSYLLQGQYCPSPVLYSVHTEPGILQDTSYSSQLSEGQYYPSPLPYPMPRDHGLQDRSFPSILQEGQHGTSPLPYSMQRDHGLLQDMIPIQVEEEPSEGILGNLRRSSF